MTHWRSALVALAAAAASQTACSFVFIERAPTKHDLYMRLSQQAPPQPGPGIAIPASAVIGACLKDTDCKGARICDAGACVDPKPPPQ